ncbi:hypothetical protein ACTA71_004398 [Dictyostelium dimigraforme]
MNNDVLFFKIFKNKYLNKKIFEFIKLINKKLKYARYNYYQCSTEFIVNNKDQQLLSNKFKDYLNLKSKSNTTIQDNLNNHFDFGSNIFLKILLWKELDYKLFKDIIITFKKEIKSFSINNIILIYLTFYNGSCIKKLKLIIKHIINNNNNNNNSNNNNNQEEENHNNNDYNNILKLLKEEVILRKNEIRINDMSIEVFNFIFFEIKLKLDDGDILSLILNNFNENVNSEILEAFFNLLPNQFFETNFESILSINSFKYILKNFINYLISTNNKTLLKQCFLKFSIKDSNNKNKENEIIKIFGNNFLIETVINLLQINSNSFKSNCDGELIELFKLLYKNDIFNINQESYSTTTIIINGIEIYEYLIELYGDDNLNKLPFKFSFECIKDKYSKLVQSNRMEFDYYKSKVFEENIELFIIYLNNFKFDNQRLLEIVDLGYENMATYVIKDTFIHIIEPKLFSINEHYFFIQLFLKSFPTNQNDGSQYLFDLLLPFVNSNINNQSFNFNNNQLILFLSNSNLPFNRDKRMKFINNTNGIKNFYQLKNNLFFSKSYSYNNNNYYRKSINDLENQSNIIINLIDIINPISILSIHHYLLLLFIHSINTCNFKLIKKLILKNENNRFPKIDLYLLFRLIDIPENSKLKSLFFLVKNVGKLNFNICLFITSLAKICSNNSQWLDFILGLNNFSNLNYDFFYLLSNGYGNDLFEVDDYYSNKDGLKEIDENDYILRIQGDILLILFQLKFVSYISNKIEEEIVIKFKKQQEQQQQQFNFSKHYKSSLKFIKNCWKTNTILIDLELRKKNSFIGRLKKSELLDLFGLNQNTILK